MKRWEQRTLLETSTGARSIPFDTEGNRREQKGAEGREGREGRRGLCCIGV